VAKAVGDFIAGAVRAVEGRAQIREELGAISLDAGAEPVEDLHGQAGGVVGGFEHQRRNGADEDCLGDALGSVAANVARHLAAAGGVPHVDRVCDVEELDQLGEIVGVGVQIVAVPRLAGAAMAAAVVSNATEAIVAEEVHLVFKRVGGQGPAVAEDYGLP